MSPFSALYTYGQNVSASERDTEVILIATFANGQTMDADRLRATVVDAFYEINVTTFIPFDHVTAPVSFSGFFRLFAGDDRSFSRMSDRYRTRQLLLVTPFEEFDSDHVITYRQSTGKTIEYDRASSLDPNNPSRLLQSAKDELEIEANRSAPYKINWTRASGDSMAAYNLPTARHVSEQRLSANEGDPLVSGAPGVTYELRVKIDASVRPIRPRYKLAGEHDGFPSFEVYIDSHTIYTHDPQLTGDGPWSVGPPAEYDFNESGDL